MNLKRTVTAWGSVLAMLAVTSGCSSFRSDVKRARKAPSTVASIAGVWEGRWYSEKKPDHGGPMQMVVSPVGETLYRFSSRARWWRVFRSAYDTRLVVTPVRPGEYLIQGGRNIWAFGDHALFGRVVDGRLEATYKAGSSVGKLELQKAH